MKRALLLPLLLAATCSFAQEKPEGPCKEIHDACVKAGFVKGDAKAGYGLWVDCIDPIMKGTAQPAKAVKPLPAVSGDLVAACKAKHPNFGQGKPKK